MVRLATVSDVADIQALCLRANNEYPSELTISEQLPEFITAWVTANRAEKVLFVSEQKGKVVGMLVGFATVSFWSSDKEAHEVLWWMDADYRHTRDALTMFAAFEFWAKTAGCKACRMGSVTGWSLLNAFYKKHGYTEVETSFRKIL